MVGNVTKLIQEQLPNVKQLTEELFQSKTPKQDEDWDAEIPKQCPQTLAEEEETLRAYLDKLRKENFILRTSLKAWETTLETKLDEFNKANSKLEELYNEIWSERERFCSKLDEFNQEYGILSKWWEMQVNYVTELEKGKTPEDRECEKEIETLEKEIGELKQKIEELEEARKRETTEMSPVTAISTRDESKMPDTPKQVTKKVKFSEVVEEYNIPVTTGGDPANDLYSVVDLEKVKNAKRRRKNLFFCTDKKPLQTPQK